ncbi:MAG: cobyric acid synthase, partial [Proteocatella sp.]
KPRVEMNPVLLKPAGNNISQVILMGKIYGNLDSFAFKKIKLDLKPEIMKAYNLLSKDSDIIVIEGAGSPAEININEDDIANMGMAKMVDAPVILVADIDRGGVFASIYGTVMLLSEEDRSRIKGIVINKFRGRVELLQDGIDKIEKLTGKPVLGVIPYTNINLEDEDSLTEKYNTIKTHDKAVNVEIIRLPHLSNATDFDVFRYMNGVNVRYVGLDENFNNPDLIIIPGTKNTVQDLVAFKQGHLYNQLYELNRKFNVPVIGICGGYQMLGKTIYDPMFVESSTAEVSGLGLLSHETTFESEKVTTQVKAQIGTDFIDSSIFDGTKDLILDGYELHCGRTKIDETKDTLFTEIKERLGSEHKEADGVVNKEQNVMGTYLHGIFDNIDFTNKLISNIKLKKGISLENQEIFNYDEFKNNEFKKLEKHFRENLDMSKIYEIIG